MSQLTNFLKLFKWNTSDEADLEEEFDIDTSMNDNWDKIDTAIEDLDNNKVDKVEGKGLSTNDFTNEAKNKLDGLSNYDDSEIKQDIANIQDEQATQNENIQANTDKNTAQDELIDKLKGNMFNLTAEGTSINVQDASDLPAVLEVSGGVRQDGREGYNLFNSDKALTSQTKTQGGATVTKNNDKSFTVTGSGNLTASFGGGYIDYTHEETLKILKTGQYTCYFGAITYPICAIQFFKKENDKETLLISRDNGSNIKAVIDITDEIINSTGLFIRVYLYGASGRQIVPGTIYPMLYEGTEEKPFEGYGATPSPDYPSEVEVVEGTLEINKVNKNLINFNKDSYNWSSGTCSTLGSVVTFSNNQFIGASNRNSTKFNCFISKGTTINMSKRVIKGSENYVSGWIMTNPILHYKDGTSYKKNIAFNNSNDIKQVKNETLTLEKDVIAISIEIGASCNINGTLEVGVQIEKNEQATDYIPHESKVYNLPIQQPMLSGDTFVKENGNWFEVHGWKKVVFTGDEEFGGAGVKDVSFISSITDYVISNDIICFSNYFKSIPNVTSASDIGGKEEDNIIAFINNHTNYRFYVKSSQYYTTTLKSFLADKYNAGNPVYVWYKLATPTKLPCTPEQTQVLEQLYNMPTYRPVTNIFTQEDLANLKLNYVADSKIYVDNKISMLAEQILNK